MTVLRNFKYFWLDFSRKACQILPVLFLKVGHREFCWNFKNEKGEKLMGSVVKKRRKKMAKHKHKKQLDRDRHKKKK